MSTSDTVPTEKVSQQGLSEQSRVRLRNIAIPVGAALALLLIWQFGVRIFEIPIYIAPAPTDIVSVFKTDFPLLMLNFWPTFMESLAGFFIGNLTAVLIAVAFVHSRLVERAFFPIAVFINTIPILAIAPILVLIFGPGMTAKVVISA